MGGVVLAQLEEVPTVMRQIGIVFWMAGALTAGWILAGG